MTRLVHWLVFPLLVLPLALSAAEPPQVGDVAPDFELVASDGKTYELADFRGKQAVVIAWYPKAFTGGCTIECKSLAENGDQIRQYDVTYFMASTDSVDANTAFAQKYGADFPLLSDPTGKVAERYGVLQGSSYARRWTFYVGKNGRILDIDRSVRPATAAEDMVRKLEALGIPRKDS